MYSDVSLTISDLWLERGESDLLKGLSFSAQSGDLVHLTGANGIGKSSFFKVLLGRLPILTGTVHYNAKELALVRPQFLQASLYLGHASGLHGALSVVENLRWYFPSCSTQDLHRVLQELGLMGFIDSRIQTLSAGQARRVALARLWLSDKPIWLLDEPFTSLDQSLIALVETKMAQHIADGGMILLISHLPLVSLRYHCVEL